MNFNNHNINLPKTKFSMKANLIIKEQEILKKWTNENIYQIFEHSKKNTKHFFLHDGPPYANGNIHLGHAVNKILKDIIVKSKRLSNFYAPYIPCWDCHGLPIEHQIEKKLKIQIKNFTILEFHKICRKYVFEQIKQQKKDFVRLGILADWKNANLTMNYENEANTLLILKKIIEKKKLYRGFKPIYWCFDCQSSLAEAEIEYFSKKCQSIFFTMDLINSEKIFKKKIKNFSNFFIKKKKISLIIYTTTLWTIPICQAIALHPKIEYILFETSSSLFICAKKLLPILLKKKKIIHFIKISILLGKEFDLLKVLHPITKQKIPIILSQYVTEDLGTGAVQMAPDHGIEDFFSCKHYNIHPKNIIDSLGKYNFKKYDLLNQTHIFKSSKIILKILQQKNCIFLLKNIFHSYPHCWRHKTPVIFRATPQWFIKIDQTLLQKKILKKIDFINWIPKWGNQKMKILVKNRPDWCISRQRKWGVPLPLFIHKKTKKLHPDTILIIKNFCKIVKKKGSQIWWNLDPQILLNKNFDEYEKVSDIIDVWFESGSNHQLKIYKYNVLNKKNYIADLCIEGSDQHRGWYMSSLIISMCTRKSIPYKTVITHGFVVDQKKQKMSKSLENIISPQKIIQIWGADILRLWVAYTDYSNEISISDKILKQTSEYYRRIRNTVRFLLANLYDFVPSLHSIPIKKILILDHWILNITKKFQKKIIKNYSKFDFHTVVKNILNFCSIQLSSRYFEIVKDRLYMFKKNSLERRSSQTVLYYILHCFVRWISPILSFTADEIWNYIPEKLEHSIFVTTWYNLKKKYFSKTIFDSKIWKILFLLRDEIYKKIEQKREKKIIRSNLEVKIILYVSDSILEILKRIHSKELPLFFSVSQIVLKKYHIAPKNLKNSNHFKKCKILIKKSIGRKCIRCWHYIENFKKNFINTNICSRCFLNIYGTGEKRTFF
ncbi:isoleucine--tRNA ligase [Buchnera aphidicola]|uniref:isoleucine--tRNA ligase n=1 Tax=Buchnera aphidicola TaxID=9 RepID=UPI0031B8A822